MYMRAYTRTCDLCPPRRLYTHNAFIQSCMSVLRVLLLGHVVQYDSDCFIPLHDLMLRPLYIHVAVYVFMYVCTYIYMYKYVLKTSTRKEDAHGMLIWACAKHHHRGFHLKKSSVLTTHK